MDRDRELPLERYWDALVDARDAPPMPDDLDPSLAATVRRLHVLDRAPGADSAFAKRLWGELKDGITQPSPVVRLVAYPTTSPNGRSAPAMHWQPAHRRRLAAQLATAALLVLTLASSLFVFGQGRPTFGPEGESSTIPAVAATAQPAVGGRIAFSRGWGQTLDIWAINADGSNLVQLTSGADGEYDPAWSPDGTKLAFTAGFGSEPDDGIYVMNADGSGLTKLPGPPGSAGPAWSPGGTKIAFAAWGDDLTNITFEIYAINADGTGLTRLTDNEVSDEHPAWSPDGTRIAFIADEWRGHHEVHVMNADGSGRTRLTTVPEPRQAYDRDLFPTWSPDGTKIAFVASRSGASYVAVINADGTGLIDGLEVVGRPSWSPDGRRIVFSYMGSRILVMNADGSGLTPLTGGARDFAPAWSPDGTKIAFDRTGRIAVMNANGSDLVFLTWGSDPVWQPQR